MREKKAAEIAQEAAEAAIAKWELHHQPYSNTFSTLTIHFAEGSEPRAISVPYRPFENRTDISLPFRLVKVDE